MTYGRAVVLGTCVLLFMLAAHPGVAADAPAPKEGHWVVRDFRFHTGEVLPELRLHYHATDILVHAAGSRYVRATRAGMAVSSRARLG